MRRGAVARMLTAGTTLFLAYRNIVPAVERQRMISFEVHHKTRTMIFFMCWKVVLVYGEMNLERDTG